MHILINENTEKKCNEMKCEAFPNENTDDVRIFPNTTGFVRTLENFGISDADAVEAMNVNLIWIQEVSFDS